MASMNMFFSPLDESQAALAAGWSNADVEWEKKQELAAALAGKDAGRATVLWMECLQIARVHFADEDPRLGASLANVGLATLNDKREEAVAMLKSARDVWTYSAAWIDRMTLEQRARSSSHHFRLEQKNRRVYQAAEKRRMHDYAAAARSTINGICPPDTNNVNTATLDNDIVPARRLRQWQKKRPPIFGDSRKLLAACLLLMAAGD